VFLLWFSFLLPPKFIFLHHINSNICAGINAIKIMGFYREGAEFPAGMGIFGQFIS